MGGQPRRRPLELARACASSRRAPSRWLIDDAVGGEHLLAHGGAAPSSAHDGGGASSSQRRPCTASSSDAIGTRGAASALSKRRSTTAARGAAIRVGRPGRSRPGRARGRARASGTPRRPTAGSRHRSRSPAARPAPRRRAARPPRRAARPARPRSAPYSGPRLVVSSGGHWNGSGSASRASQSMNGTEPSLDSALPRPRLLLASLCMPTVALLRGAYALRAREIFRVSAGAALVARLRVGAKLLVHPPSRRALASRRRHHGGQRLHRPVLRRRPWLRSLSKMLARCDRVGKEVYLQATETGIVLRSLNLSQSAFVVFNLKLDFFADFLWNPHDQGRSVSIKLFLKNVVSVFKNVAALEKAWLQLACGGGESYLRIQQFCKNGTRKKFDLAFEEETPLQAVYQRDACAHRVTAEPVLLTNCLGHFPPGVSEVTLQLEPTQLVLKNEVDAAGATQDEGQRAEKVAVRTEMQVQAEDLQRYEVGAGSGGVTVSFSQREFNRRCSRSSRSSRCSSRSGSRRRRGRSSSPPSSATARRPRPSPSTASSPPSSTPPTTSSTTWTSPSARRRRSRSRTATPPPPSPRISSSSTSSSSTSSRARLRRGRARRRAHRRRLRRRRLRRRRRVRRRAAVAGVRAGDVWVAANPRQRWRPAPRTAAAGVLPATAALPAAAAAAAARLRPRRRQRGRRDRLYVARRQLGRDRLVRQLPPVAEQQRPRRRRRRQQRLGHGGGGGGRRVAVPRRRRARGRRRPLVRALRAVRRRARASPPAAAPPPRSGVGVPSSPEWGDGGDTSDEPVPGTPPDHHPYHRRASASASSRRRRSATSSVAERLEFHEEGF